MCPPAYFGVSYRINPWMWPAVPVDRDLAWRQWDELRATYVALGHEVEIIEPGAGLPDMVFAANAGLVVDAKVLTARFRHDERRGEEAPYHAWFATNGFAAVRTGSHVNEGEGDFAVVGDLILAGTGFRSDPESHDEVAEFFGRKVVSLRLVDDRYYHLDTALCVLDDEQIAYYPPAFDDDGRATLEELFPHAIRVSAADAEVLGCNAASDGYHVVVPAGAHEFSAQLADAGYEPIPVDLSELRKAGGAAKCCTLELRADAAKPPCGRSEATVRTQRNHRADAAEPPCGRSGATDGAAREPYVRTAQRGSHTQGSAS